MKEELNKPRTKNEDWFLQDLVDYVDGTDLEIGITLQCNGFLVSGNLCSGHLYFEEFGKSFYSLTGNDSDKKTISEYAAKALEAANEFDDLVNKDISEKPLIHGPFFIHLKNAQFHQVSGGEIPMFGVLWRGQIKDINGFFLGTIKGTES